MSGSSDPLAFAWMKAFWLIKKRREENGWDGITSWKEHHVYCILRDGMLVKLYYGN